jgi:uncharacterized protein (DUF362 family)
MANFNRRFLLKFAGAAAGFYIIGGHKSARALAGEAPPASKAGEAAAGNAASGAAAQTSGLKGKVSVARGDDPYKNTLKAIALLGGMKLFVKPGAKVVVKPNIGWNRVPSACATTNPDVVKAVVEECVKAGAAKVEVYDRPCEDPRRCYARSGIEKAAKDAGATVRFIEDYEYVDTEIPRGDLLKKWPVVEGILKADAVINVPIAKDHDSATLTMAVKNLMGVMGGERGDIHTNMGQKLADFCTRVVPTLNVLDANSILVAHGPQGGGPSDIKSPHMVIAGVEAVTVDAYAAANLPWTMAPGRKVAYLDAAKDLDIGVVDPSAIKVIE